MRKMMAAALAGTMMLVAAPATAATFFVEVGTISNPNGGGTSDIPKFRIVNNTDTGTNLLPTITSATLSLDAASSYTFGAVSNFSAGSAGIGLGGDGSPAASNPAVTASAKSIILNYGLTAFDPGAYSAFTVDFGPGVVNFRDALFSGNSTLLANFSDGSKAQVTFRLNASPTAASYRFDSTDVTAAVPEPATWAMMMVGFGMVAGAARYRRRSTSAVHA